MGAPGDKASISVKEGIYGAIINSEARNIVTMLLLPLLALLVAHQQDSRTPLLLVGWRVNAPQTVTTATEDRAKEAKDGK